MSEILLKQDVVMESDSNVKLPEFPLVPKAMPSPLSNRVKLQYAVTAKLSRAIPASAAFSMKCRHTTRQGLHLKRDLFHLHSLHL